MSYVIFASYGNDSIALIQFAHERGLKDVHVAYTDTGWAADWWGSRVEQAEAWVKTIGFTPHRIMSGGMESLVMRKKAWPRGGGGRFQFCTESLKKVPARSWLEIHDPDGDATCMVGVRREESEKRRDAPEWVEKSAEHGDRELWQPLVRHTSKQRDELISKTPMQILPFRSKECWPCVNAQKQELKHMDESTRNRVFRIEQESGVNSKGNARVMFSPARHGGAVGIDAVIEDAKHDMDELFQTSACSSGWCGG